MDEELIREVQLHSVIYNRQKYFLNNVGHGKFETKESAWCEIARKIGTDIETCKKRWKYLRERYVQTRKQGDPPTYEHLSRPYLEKMNFLDQHIQPRKSYRNSSSFHTSPNAAFGEYIDSRSNSSMQRFHPGYSDSLVTSIKSEPESFQNFANVNASQNQNHPQQQHSEQAPQSLKQNPQQLPQQPQQPPPQHSTGGNAMCSIPLPQQPHPPSNNHQHNIVHSSEFRETENLQIPSSSSSLRSPLSSPQMADHHDISAAMKRPRLLPNRHHTNDEDDDSSDNDEARPQSLLNQQQQHQQQQHQQREQMINEERRKNGRLGPDPYPNNDFLYSVYQRFAPQNQGRSSEQLLGELVTSELLKMNREKRKIAQRRILEVLFFDD